MLNGFVKVRRGIIEHLYNGQMNMNEFACYSILLLKADYKTGVAWVNSSDFTIGDVSLSSVQRALTGLEEKKYIKRFMLPGSKKPYPVLIDKFEVSCGSRDGSDGEPKRINVVKSSSWKYPVYESADEPLRSRWGGDDEPLLTRYGPVTDEPATIEESTTSDPKEVRSKNLEKISEKEEQEDMNIRTALTDKSREILGVRIAPGDSNWSEVKALVRAYGDLAVVDKFEQWAKSLTSPPNYPLSGFIRIADALLSGKFAGSASPDEVSSLAADLAGIANGRIAFNNKQKAVLSGILTNNSPEDIKSVFTEFYGNIEGDDFLIRNGAKDFVETAEQRLFVQAKRREDARKTAEMVARCTENEQAKAREEAEELLRKAEEEEFLVEDTLPDENLASQ